MTDTTHWGGHPQAAETAGGVRGSRIDYIILVSGTTTTESGQALRISSLMCRGGQARRRVLPRGAIEPDGCEVSIGASTEKPGRMAGSLTSGVPNVSELEPDSEVAQRGEPPLVELASLVCLSRNLIQR